MERQNTTTRFHHRFHLLVLRRAVLYANVLGLSSWLFLRIIFYDLPFVLSEELLILAKILGWSTAFGVATAFVIFAVDGIRYMIRNRKRLKVPAIMQVPHHSVNKSRTV